MRFETRRCIAAASAGDFPNSMAIRSAVSCILRTFCLFSVRVSGTAGTRVSRPGVFPSTRASAFLVKAFFLVGFLFVFFLYGVD